MNKMLQEWMPHGHCYAWTPDVYYGHVASDLLIGFSYLVISVALFRLAIKRPELLEGLRVLSMLFGLFIILCGATHFVDIWTTHRGHYRLESIFKVLCAIASAATARLSWSFFAALARNDLTKDWQQEKHEREHE